MPDFLLNLQPPDPKLILQILIGVSTFAFLAISIRAVARWELHEKRTREVMALLIIIILLSLVGQFLPL